MRSYRATPKLLLGLVVGSVLVGAGVAWAFSGYVGREAESGALSSPSLVASDPSASAGQAVRFGTNNPGELTMPTASTVGPRCAPTETITAAVALTRLRASGRLSCVTVTGTFTLAGPDGINWIIEDVRFETRGGLYGVNGFRGGGGVNAFTGTQAQRPVLRYVEVLGGPVTGHGTCSAVVIGKDMIFQHANITGCQDGIKADDRLEIYNSWIHDHDYPDGAHSDGVQIVSGQNIIFRGNRFDAYSTYSSDGSKPAGSWDYASGMLQTGTVSGDISATWENNWFVGGRYTIRGDDEYVYNVAYVFRDNRWLRYGSSVVLGRSDLPPNQYGPTARLGAADFDCSNVWDDTNSPILSGC